MSVAVASEAVERVAKEIGSAAVPHNRFSFRDLITACLVVSDGPIALTLMPRGVDFILEEIARLAIVALREPTRVMLEAGATEHRDPWSERSCSTMPEVISDIWQSMIDVALETDAAVQG